MEPGGSMQDSQGLSNNSWYNNSINNKTSKFKYMNRNRTVNIIAKFPKKFL